jgi:hypothetical protein
MEEAPAARVSPQSQARKNDIERNNLSYLSTIIYSRLSKEAVSWQFWGGKFFLPM